MKDIYVQFRGKFKIDGESRDSEHAKWLEVSTWSQLIRQPKSATASSAGGHTAERCEHGDMAGGDSAELSHFRAAPLMLLAAGQTYFLFCGSVEAV